MLHVHRSDRTEVLLEAFAGLLHDTPLDDPMLVEPVLVGSAGMARWLEGGLARASPHGVCAGVETLFPGTFVSRVATTVLATPPPRVDPWSPGLLTWGIAELLPDLLAATPPGDDDPWAAVRRYVAPDGTDPAGLPVTRRLLALAGDVADRFDRYALHRPQLLDDWRRGRDVDTRGEALGHQRWQALLWRAVAAQLPVASPAGRVADAVAVLRDGADVDGLPPRVAVFGLSSLPRLHLSLLAALARDRPVHLYVPSPSDARWRAGLANPGEQGVVDAPAPTVLLRAGGPVAGDTARLVAGAAATAEVELDDVLLPGPAPDLAGPTAGSVLDRLRRTVVDAVVPTTRRAPAPDDTSVVLHACRGQLRQVEVLRDELRRRLDADPTLQPRDVVVLTPDLATYGPLAAAVLAAPGDDRPGSPPPLPVAVADRAPGHGNELALALLRAVRLVRSRATAAEVLDLVTTGPVLRHHGIDPLDVGTLERWVADVGVRWARDADDRRRAGLPASDAHTWRAGLDRLLLGIALPGDDDRVLAGRAPHRHMEDTDDLDLLERLVVVLQLVDDLRRLRVPRDAGAWLVELRALLDALTGPADGHPWQDDTARSSHRRQRAAVEAALAELEPLEVFQGRDVEVEALLQWLERALAAPARGAGGFATGAVTVAGLVPLRAVPFRVVCLLGMDEGSFPRQARRSTDDLLAGDRRAGDDDPRAEDRHAFVEAVLAARDALVVTWTGFDPRRGDVRLPAAPVVDLQEALDGVVEGGAAAVTHEHPVLPTSPTAFTGPSSYDHDRRDAAVRTLRPVTAVPPFAPPSAPPSAVPGADEPAVTSLDALARDVVDPPAALLRALGVATGDRANVLPTVDPVALPPLGVAEVGRALLERLRTGSAPAEAEAALLASGAVPAGTPGRLLLAEISPLAVRLATLARTGEPRAPVAVELAVDGRRVVGSVDAVAGAGGLLAPDVRFTRPSHAHRVAAWVRHLAACASATVPVTTVLARRPERSGDPRDVPHVEALLPVAAVDALELLRPWVHLHERATRDAVRFHPVVSMAWAEAIAGGGSRDEAIDAVAKVHEPLEDEVWQPRVLLDDPRVRLVWRDRVDTRALVDDEFVDLAERLLQPLREAIAAGRDRAAAALAEVRGTGAAA